MKKWTFRISLILTVMASSVEISRFYQRIEFKGLGDQAFAVFDLGLFLFLILVTIAAAALLVWSFLGTGVDHRLQGVGGRKHLYWGLGILLALILLESVQNLLYLHANLKEIYYPVSLLKNRELFVWAGVVSGQSLVAWLLIGWKVDLISFPSWRSIPTWLLVGVAAGVIIHLAGGRGDLPPNAPLPMLHILVIILTLFLGRYALRFLSRKIPWLQKLLKKELLALVVIWLVAFALWSNVPLQSNYFIDAPRPPNKQFTPTSDAIYYEIQSQRLLAGEGFEERVQHSFYNYLLSGLHALGGDNYLDIYKLQIALLAFTPFLLYKLASLMYSRMAGWLTAALFAMREYNALHLGDSITVSNVQELMTEPLALLGVVLFLYLTVLWIKEERDSWSMPLLIGAVIAVTALIRVELLSLAPVFGFTLLINYWRSWKKWLVPGVFTLLGLILVLTPWLIRNYQQTGQVTIDKGLVVERTVRNYLGQPTTSQGSDQGGGLKLILNCNLKKITRIWDRSSTSLQQTLVYLPSNHFPLAGADNFINFVPEKGKVYFFQDGMFSDVYLTKYIKSLPYWEMRWEGKLTPRSIFPQLLVISILSLGIFLSWKKRHCLGFLPLVTMLTHILVYAIVIGSGGRYIQVADWITLFYFSIGLAGVLDYFTKRIPGEEDLVEETPPGSNGSYSSWQGLALSGLVFLVVLSMPLVEGWIPQRYSETYLESVLDDLESESGTEMFPGTSTGSEVLIGKALYPSFYTEEQTFLDDRAGRMPDVGLNQMVFYLIGTRNIWVSLPVDHTLKDFPHGVDVIIQGELKRDTPQDLERKLLPYFLAEKVLVVPD